jgi:hypothetical protein
MEKKLFAQFVKLNEKLHALKEERDILRASIVEEMRKEKVTKQETDYGIFTRAIRKSWLYTGAVDRLKEKVKLAEVREQNKGLAQAVKTEYLRFTHLTD